MRVVRTIPEAVEALGGEPELALDLETGGLSPWRDPIHVVTLYGAQSDTAAVLHFPRSRPVLKSELAWLEDVPELIAHNGASFDIIFMGTHGVDWTKTRWYDTLVGEQVSIASGRQGIRVNLADTLKRRLGKIIDKNIDHGGWGADLLSDRHLEYCLQDISYLVDLRREQENRCSQRETQLKCLAFEMSLIPVIVSMELNGLPINLERLKEYEKIQEERIKEASELLKDRLGDILLTSPVQLKRALGARFGERAFPDTKAERLMSMARLGGDVGETCEALLLFRQADQRRKMYRPEWREKFIVSHSDGIYRVHGRFWQVSTDTGRMSSSDPNLQQIPRDMRAVFGDYPGVAIGKTDMAQIEVRVAAALAEDDRMIKAINEGEDIHTFVAAQAFGVPVASVTKDQRTVAKAMNFLLLFGGGADGLYAYAQTNGSSVSREEIDSAYELYYERFPGIRRLKQSAINHADSGRPFSITYPTGLRRVIAGPDLVHTTILNNSVQGTAAAGLKMALVEAHKRGLSKYLAAAVHDEIVYVAPESEMEEVRREIDDCVITGMREALSVLGTPPVSIGVESTWGVDWRGSPERERKTESGV